ncbi:heparinase II/III domain-containing protein [Pontimicrobium sp. MEBiC01747]
MDYKKLKRLYNTVKYLKIKQVYYRLYYFIRNKLYKKNYKLPHKPIKTTALNCYRFYNPSSRYDDCSFTFLNKTKTFKSVIDWNFPDYGKLWTYNLNYFEFLNQPEITEEKGLKLINDYINNNHYLKDGLEPYPISLRTINWIKFLSRYNITDKKINNALYLHYKQLCDNLEYHLLGNHLLENAFSLLFGAYFFNDEYFYKKAINILKVELKEQILNDGAHFELSPMYHQIILFKVLDSIYLVKNNKWKENELLSNLITTAKKMLLFLKEITYSNGDIPMVNDSTFDIAPTTKKLLELASVLKIDTNNNIKLNESGYRKAKKNNYELFYDIGHVGPSYQPGHAHSDTFNFELYYKGNPFIVDTGISTYEKNTLRQIERSTASHNTVLVKNIEQTDVWGGFRVGKRAKITYLKETDNKIIAGHNGYKAIGISHERSFTHLNDEITIEDKITGDINIKTQAALHLHPNIKIAHIDNNIISFDGLDITITFDNNYKLVTTEKYNYCFGFNKTVKAVKIVIEFDEILTTKIKCK